MNIQSNMHSGSVGKEAIESGRRSFADQIIVPRRPVILLPTLSDAHKVLLGNVDVNELDPAPSCVGQNDNVSTESIAVRGQFPTAKFETLITGLLR